MSAIIISERISMIKDLEQTFKFALEAGDYKAAIQAKHMIGKMQGFFDSKKQAFSLMELSQEDLEMLIKEAEDIKKWEISSKDVKSKSSNSQNAKK